MAFREMVLEAPASSEVSVSADAHAEAAWDSLVASADVPADTPPPAEATNAPVEGEVSAEPAPKVEGTNPESLTAEPAAKVETAKEQTAYEKWVAKYGDPNKAAEAAWETNNRASELAAKLKEAEAKLASIPATNAAEPAQPAPTPEPVAEPAVSPEQVEQWVKQQTAQDATCQAWVGEFQANSARLAVLNDPASPDSIPAAASEVATLKAWLKHPLVADDDFQKREYSAQLVLAEAKHERLQLEAQRRQVANAQLDSQFSSRVNQYRAQVNEHYQAQARAAREKQEFDSQVTRHATELEKAWGPAFDRTIKEYKVPESEIEDFGEDLKTFALAKLEAGIKVEDLDSFMGQYAKRLMERLDKHHRTKSAEYARQATQRAASPAPAPVASPQVQPSNSGDPMKAVYEREAQEWARLAGL